MSIQIDYNDARYAQAAAEILRRRENGEPEANITSAVRDFLILTGLVKADDIVEENPPAQGSRRAVDLAALDTFIEFKRRIGTAGGFNPNPEYVQQLDDYLEQSGEQGRMRMGILTDGKRWLLRWPNAGPVRTAMPYAFTLEDADRWITLFEWLRDHALSAEVDALPRSPALVLYDQHTDLPVRPTHLPDIGQPTEVGGLPLLRPLARRPVGRAWGAGVAEAVNHFIEAANEAKEVLEWLRFSVAGISRAAWVLQPAIQAAVEDGFAANVTVPVYLGDALQLRFRTGDMFAEHNVTVQVEDEENTELVFPVSLVERAETFDALMSDIAEAIERGDGADRGDWELGPLVALHESASG